MTRNDIIQLAKDRGLIVTANAGGDLWLSKFCDMVEDIMQKERQANLREQRKYDQLRASVAAIIDPHKIPYVGASEMLREYVRAALAATE